MSEEGETWSTGPQDDGQAPRVGLEEAGVSLCQLELGQTGPCLPQDACQSFPVDAHGGWKADAEALSRVEGPGGPGRLAERGQLQGQLTPGTHAAPLG